MRALARRPQYPAGSHTATPPRHPHSLWATLSSRRGGEAPARGAELGAESVVKLAAAGKSERAAPLVGEAAGIVSPAADGSIEAMAASPWMAWGASVGVVKPRAGVVCLDKILVVGAALVT